MREEWGMPRLLNTYLFPAMNVQVKGGDRESWERSWQEIGTDLLPEDDHDELEPDVLFLVRLHDFLEVILHLLHVPVVGQLVPGVVGVIAHRQTVLPPHPKYLGIWDTLVATVPIHQWGSYRYLLS